MVLGFSSPGAPALQGLLLPTQEGGSWPQMAPASQSCLCRKKAGAPSFLGLWLDGRGQGKLRAGRGLLSSPAVQSEFFTCILLFAIVDVSQQPLEEGAISSPLYSCVN